MDNKESDHFISNEVLVKKIYDRLIREVKKFGPVTIEPKKTSIHLVSRFAFAGVYTRKSYINLEFQLSYQLTSSRIIKAEHISPNRFHHTIKLTSENELDKELLVWLKEAYDLKK